MFAAYEVYRRMPKLAVADLHALALSGKLAQLLAINPTILQAAALAAPSPVVTQAARLAMGERRPPRSRPRLVWVRPE